MVFVDWLEFVEVWIFFVLVDCLVGIMKELLIMLVEFVIRLFGLILMLLKVRLVSVLLVFIFLIRKLIEI